MRATYSPDDNKLRLYSEARLDAADYARMKAAGFRWAGRQKLFVAPAWSPEREDLLVELAGEIEDDDVSLMDRAEERSDAFAGYEANRRQDAERAQQAVSALSDGIPLGQPILVGHHSEKHARRDAERIENGMRKVVQSFNTANYWRGRAASAIRHAKYKERPDVRHRRIKGLEADLRKLRDQQARSDVFNAQWTVVAERALVGTFEAKPLALQVANYSHLSQYFPVAEFPRREGASPYEGEMSLYSALKDDIITPMQAAEIHFGVHQTSTVARARWIEHNERRLQYERDMLAEAGGLVTDRVEYPITVGGRVLVRGEWKLVERVNRKGGAITSVSVLPRSWPRVVSIEDIKDYQPPTAEDCLAVDARKKLPPLVNYRAEGIAELTMAEFKQRTKWTDFAGVSTAKATETYGAYRYRRIPGGNFTTKPVFITDLKVTERPALATSAPLPPVARMWPRQALPHAATCEADPMAATVDAMRESLKAGVQVVSAPQLFPTPVELAREMVDLADIQYGHRVLEPSAGTGRLLDAIHASTPTARIQAVEINATLAAALKRQHYTEEQRCSVLCSDFLAKSPEALGQFDRIVMNPPFERGSDIAHIEHARTMLAPGGRLVALCANGPRQRERLRPQAHTWIDLPPGSFAEAGTHVNVALLVITRPRAEQGR